jgi:UDP-N-acetylglucosamine 2-epimerase
VLRTLCVIGTRPEAIKMAPVIAELRLRRDRVRTITCVTGQHRDMLDPILDVFGIEADYDLDVMRSDQSLMGVTAKLFEGLEPVLNEVSPDWIVAQGDTTSVLVASLAAYYLGIRFAHVEAGLRTGDLHNPFPEELNRRVADSLAAALFAPTDGARRALIAEGSNPEAIHVTGNTGIDALLSVCQREHEWRAGSLSSVPSDARIVLVTTHRRESFGQPLREICLAIRDLALACRGDDVHFIVPAHLNPNVQQPVSEILRGIPSVSVVPPLDYVTMVHLMKEATLILTDSGGIQEEAPSLSVPVLVLRAATERPEGIEAGAARLVGTRRREIQEAVMELLTDEHARRAMIVDTNPYGDGHASRRIVDVLLREGQAHGA